jgi:1-deoxy-D-xylulose 5-phosphate reductoisomerase
MEQSKDQSDNLSDEVLLSASGGAFVEKNITNIVEIHYTVEKSKPENLPVDPEENMWLKCTQPG